MAAVHQGATASAALHKKNLSFVKFYAAEVSHSLLRDVNEFLSQLATFNVSFGRNSL
jgi:hypothetical protein